MSSQFKRTTEDFVCDHNTKAWLGTGQENVKLCLKNLKNI